MRELLELTDDLSVSRPIFELTLNEDGSRINFPSYHPIYKYEPPAELLSTPLGRLIAGKYSESFSMTSGEYVIDKRQIVNSAMEKIRWSMCHFIERGLPMRNPVQSKLYRWYYRHKPNTTDFNNVMIMVYKYLVTFCDEDDNMRPNSKSDPNVSNAIALLTAIMEKYE